MTQERPPIVVNDQHEYFIAIFKSRQHSLIAAGVHDHISGENKILCSVGKYIEPDVSYFKAVLMMLVSKIASRLEEERFVFNDHFVPITYQAFSINEANYLDFLTELKNCPQAQIGAYQKTHSKQGVTTFHYHESLQPQYPPQNQALAENTQNIHIANTCRHTALKLLETGTRSKTSTQMLSSFYFRALPHEGFLSKGRAYQFFIFLLPPVKKQLAPETYRVLSKIYHRMEAISKSYRTNPDTLNKFESLKKLYQRIDTRKEKDNILDVLTIIHQWQQENSLLIDKTRGFAFFKTKTRKMVDEFTQLQKDHLQPKR